MRRNYLKNKEKKPPLHQSQVPRAKMHLIRTNTVLSDHDEEKAKLIGEVVGTTEPTPRRKGGPVI